MGAKVSLKQCAAWLLLGILVLSTVSCGIGTIARLHVSVNGKGSVAPKSGTFFPIGETITLVANPKSGWEFSHWEGDVSGSQNPIEITMDSSKSIKAYFNEMPPLDYTGSDLRINTTSLPAWIEGTFGSFSVNATGGKGKLSWTGTPPEPWIALSPSGVISGTAPLLPYGTSMRITAPFTATVIDEERHARRANYTITILPKSPEIIPKNITARWDENDPPYDNVIRPLATITSGYPPYRMAIPGSFGLPLGMKVAIDTDGVTLILIGPPPKAKFKEDTHKFQIYIVDSNNFQASADVTLVVIKKKVEGTTISGKVTNKETGALEGNAVITIDIINNAGKDVSISVTSTGTAIDSAGNNYTIFLPADMPDTTPTTNIILNCTKSGFIPLAGTVENDMGSWLLDFPLEPIAGESILIDSRLHHLGDNSYEGAINSQFQTSAEGSTYSKSFTVESGQLTLASARLYSTHRGAQNNNLITINGVTIGYLNYSPSDGSLGTSYLPFDKSLLKQGTNTITITSITTGGQGGDIDDFEFNNIYITFSK